MKRHCHFLMMFLFTAIPTDITLGSDEDPRLGSLITQVDALFKDCNQPDMPGCAVGIIRQGDLIYSKGFGSANLDYGEPNTPRTIFEFASASKGFTSLCIALLLDEGKLDLDDDVRQLIPELRLDRPVRIRHMLRCESGLWDQFHIMPLAGWDNVPNHIGYSKADLFAVLTGQMQLPFEPGSEFQYGSGDFFLLGIVIERVTGQTLAQFARERLFRPLGMTRTYYEEDHGISVKSRAVGHWKGNEGWSPVSVGSRGDWRLWQTNGYVAGPGGVRTCIEDLYRLDLGFDSDVLPRGKYVSEFLQSGTVLGNRFVVDSDAYRKRMQSHPDNAPPGQYRGLKRIQFTGGFWGMAACFARFPDEKLTVICMSNSSEVSPFKTTRQIADLFLADKLAPLEPAVLDKEENVPELALERLQKLTGAFRDLRTSNSPIWRTEVRDGELMIIDHLEKAFVLKPITSSRFKPIGKSPFYPSARFEFVTADDGQATRLVLSSCENGFHESNRFERVELVQPDAAELAEYTGEYSSDEIAATYRLKLDDGKLWLRINSRRWEPLRPVVQDEFTPDHRDPHDQRFIRFSRNADGKVVGLSAGLWRVRGVSFVKSKIER